MRLKLTLLNILLLVSSNAFAGKYWIDVEGNWDVYFDNGKTYLRSPLLDSKCNYSRAYLSKTYGDDVYRNRLYAYVLAASASNKNIKIVLDDTQDKSYGSSTRCEYFGADTY
ncbi:MAG: hypothetical protein GY820_21330 [Gammaproteobacteria bacterium]|nr:hypothetical protein [Gammaproteobacteria bacterium]